MRQPSGASWWMLLVIVLAVIAAWPPDDDKSLAAKFVNWAVDPRDQLPILPAQLGMGMGDDPQLVEERDAIVRHYDELNRQGGWTRTRLHLKVAGDPMNRSTERQLLLGLAAITTFVVWRWGARPPV